MSGRHIPSPSSWLKSNTSKKPASRESTCSSCSLLIADFLLALLFDLEDGSDTFFRNVDGLQSNYAVLQN
jgi:hypothetical protein